ncbi:OPT family oligopeptide transporter [Scleromatobacter humisilvae]|uniref:OPT/YSL family transporter n=1 Tax=Scleromatobacter humisilvae TaxID=2897159 RepID=A0A9X1YQG1_9BURK|nr:OPT/YSL family transporter [Scleromatobacter humisilvae]MCK9686016.1 OPT/YSL family transporter [Scleromatobacter humisilvae]
MALLQLNEEQIKTWTRAQKDEWWLANVFRGNMPQLTVRSAVTGFLLGGILAATAMYVLAKTGIGIGVGLTSVLLSFAMFRALSNARIASDFSVLENNCTQSIATSAGYVITPLGAGLTAYMAMTGNVLSWWQMMVWLVVVSITGVLMAFPMKRRFINEDQLPFPEGRACGVVLDSLYSGGADVGLFKAKLLYVTAGITAIWELLVLDGFQRLIQFKILRMNVWAGLKEPWVLHDHLDDYYYMWLAKLHVAAPKILGTDIRQLGLRFTLDFSMLGVGGLMGLAVASSVLIGGILNLAVLAPIMIERGDIVARTLANGHVVNISRAEIVNQWSIWWGVSMMVVGAMVGLFAKPDIFTKAFKSMSKRADAPAQRSDVLKHIEVPLWVSWVGVPVFGLAGAWVTHAFFGVPWLLSLVSLPLIYVLTIICANSMGLTSWMPSGPLAKVTQFTVGMIDRANPASNLLPASMTGTIVSNAASLLSDIKPGYMLGGKPRHQVWGHVIGIFSGAIFSVPLFFLLFLRPDANGAVDATKIISDTFPMPAAVQWRGVAEIISHGFKGAPVTAIWAAGIAAVAAVVLEALRVVTKGRFPLSAVSIGLGVVLPFDSCVSMWIGAMGFWILGRIYRTPGTKAHDIWVEGAEPICAGLISAAALMGICDAILNVVMG